MKRNSIMYDQLQADAWQEYKMLVARIAFSSTPRIGKKQEFGVASLQAGFLMRKEGHAGE